MSDKERFEGFKADLIKENEEKYGDEIRSKYGDDVIDESNKKILGMSAEKWDRFKMLEKEIKEKLEKAVTTEQNPEGEAGKELTIIHKEWLMFTWKTYSSEAHKGLAKMYICDERFKSYYDDKIVGCAEFLQKAIEYWA